MRISIVPTILSVVIFLCSYVNAYRYNEHVRRNEVYAREPHYVETLSHEITARELVSELTTRGLVDELERRSQSVCNICDTMMKQSQLARHNEKKHNRGECRKCGRYISAGGNKTDGPSRPTLSTTITVPINRTFCRRRKGVERRGRGPDGGSEECARYPLGEEMSFDRPSFDESVIRSADTETPIQKADTEA
ncbi:hypothetical protein DFP72DRAFT_1051493 [Ephemerocybe angulata]|uniref:Uncharacterized protein n=1 Tax=Ephemerocybe angulata TaxID=980116 RepID=A0A8H6HFF5_9AGAR|nr:hypothetical protein DFP72DRAFT_1051493 [Tulosesus angulatus]